MVAAIALCWHVVDKAISEDPGHSWLALEEHGSDRGSHSFLTKVGDPICFDRRCKLIIKALCVTPLNVLMARFDVGHGESQVLFQEPSSIRWLSQSSSYELSFTLSER